LQGFLAFYGFHEGFDRNGEEGFLSANGDHLIGVGSEDGKDFGAVGRAKMGATRTHGELALPRGAVVAKISDDLRAEGLHRLFASNLSN
jgi:hypothetical protein